MEHGKRYCNSHLLLALSLFFIYLFRLLSYLIFSLSHFYLFLSISIYISLSYYIIHIADILHFSLSLNFKRDYRKEHSIPSTHHATSFLLKNKQKQNKKTKNKLIDIASCLTLKKNKKIKTKFYTIYNNSCVSRRSGCTFIF